MIFYILIGTCVIFELVGDYLFKSGSLVIGTSSYLISSLLWLYSLRYEDLSRASVIFILLSLVCLTLMGVICFNETLTILNWIGVGLAVISILLVCV